MVTDRARKQQLTVIRVIGSGCTAKAAVVCSCGRTKTVSYRDLLRSTVTSCGHHPKTLRHGHARAHSKSPEYRCYMMMLQRCSNPKMACFKYYGGRGISVCQRWRDSFENFLQDMGPRPSLQHSLDRYPDPNGNYEPGNVRWATHHQQSNNKTANIFLTHDGLRLTVSQWATRIGVSRYTLYSRVKRGLSTQEVLGL